MWGLGRQATLCKPTILLCILLGWASVAAGPEIPSPEASEGVEAITRPSDSRTLAFVHPGLVKKVHIEDGQWVKAGEALIQLDDAAERKQAEQLKAEAETDIRIGVAKAEFDLAKVELEKISRAARGGAATDLEVRSAEVSAEVKRLSLQWQRFLREQSRRKYEEQEIILERMQLISPIDGRVEGIVIKEGEAAEAMAKVIRLVKIDPLWIEVPVPLARARKLKEGAAVWVRFVNGESESKQVEGKIKLIRSEADAASDTLNVRVEVPNPSRRPAGEHVTVTFPPREASEDNSQEIAARTSQVKAKAKE